MRRDEQARFPLIEVQYSPNMDFWKHSTETFGVQLGLIQNLYIRCLNSIYYHAPRVKKEDESAYIGYTQAWIECILQHHSGVEESLVNPFVRQRFELCQNPNLDYNFLHIMKTLRAYLTDVNQGTSPYDGMKIRELAETLGDDLVEHLHDNQQMPALCPARLAECDTRDVETLFAKLEAYSREHVSIAFGFVLAINHHDRDMYPTWPPMPKPVRWFAENVAFWWHRDYWKFAPYDRKGEPQVYVGKDIDTIKPDSSR
ncbi:hypothetical protein CPB83DRAFT_921543 [Crepidotus variabilis]|uniref:Hemerythrin-like domain-containing protein n=1 Tax=Crepidotus variabilis TaxID=179855 RepID=A0A9P6JRT2_9AGAR|nr:hypothetical protein CPB83DRAFT_921543 [Crepidotus variabilis]